MYQKAVWLIAIIFMSSNFLTDGLATSFESITPENADRLEQLAVLGGGVVNDIEWSPNGRTLAVASARGVWLYNPQNLKATPRLLEGHTDSVGVVAYSPDGLLLASGGKDNVIRLWDPETGIELGVFEGHRDWVTELIFSLDGTRLASRSHSDVVMIWDVKSYESIATIDEYIGSMTFNPDGILSGFGSGGNFRRWDATTGKLLEQMPTDADGFMFDPDRAQTTWVDVIDGNIRLSGSNGDFLLQGPRNDHAFGFRFDSDGKRLAIWYSISHEIWIWDTGTGTVLSKLRGLPLVVYDTTFSPDGRYLASWTPDSRVIIWDVEVGVQEDVLEGPTAIVTDVAFSPDGKLIASSGLDRVIRLWDAKTYQQVAVLQGHTDAVYSITFSPDGNVLVSGSGGEYDKTIRYWDVKTGEQIAVIGGGHSAPISTLAFSLDGEILASGSWDETIRLWGEQLLVLNGHTAQVKEITFSPDNLLVSGSGDFSIRFWDIETGEEVRRLDVDEYESVNSIAISPAGDLLAAGSSSTYRIHIWNAATWTEVTILEHEGGADSVSFSPDGTLLASGSDPFAGTVQPTIRLWSVKDWQEVAILYGHTESVNHIAFNSDGTLLVSAGGDGTVRLWGINR